MFSAPLRQPEFHLASGYYLFSSFFCNTVGYSILGDRYSVLSCCRYLINVSLKRESWPDCDLHG